MIDNFHKEGCEFLSNFSPSFVFFEGVWYRTVEHAFQAAKTLDLTERLQIASVPQPGKAKKMGRKVTLRNDWESVKLDVMYSLVKKKFENIYLKHQLLSTGDEELVEGNWWGDTFWGVCDGVGENHLGKILMRVRDELRGN